MRVCRSRRCSFGSLRGSRAGEGWWDLGFNLMLGQGVGGRRGARGLRASEAGFPGSGELCPGGRWIAWDRLSPRGDSLLGEAIWRVGWLGACRAGRAGEEWLVRAAAGGQGCWDSVRQCLEPPQVLAPRKGSASWGSFAFCPNSRSLGQMGVAGLAG